MTSEYSYFDKVNMDTQLIERARQIIVDEVLPKLHTDSSHSIEHFDAVTEHCRRAVTDHTDSQKMSVILAGLLHDVDDVKLLKDHCAKTRDYSEERFVLDEYSNARFVLDKVGYDDTETVIKMIDLVSCSKNGDSHDESLPDWYYIPRYADRLEATGEIGIKRIITYNTGLGRPMHAEQTQRVSSVEEMSLVAVKERYDLYIQRRTDIYPLTVLDHVYDKIYHIAIPEWLHNTYLEEEMAGRKEYIVEWVINYWKRN